MKKYLLACTALFLLTGCSAKSTESTQASSNKTPLSSSSSQKPHSSSTSSSAMPQTIKKFASGDYSAYTGTYKSELDSSLIISTNKIYYYAPDQTLVGSVVLNQKTFSKQTTSPSFSRTYAFNTETITVTFNDTGDKITSISLSKDIYNNNQATIFKYSTAETSLPFTEQEALKILQSSKGFSDDDSYFLATKYENSYIIQVVSKAIRAQGGSGTVGLYQVFSDGTNFLVKNNPTTGAYDKIE